jgi:hypothetical protein
MVLTKQEQPNDEPVIESPESSDDLTGSEITHVLAMLIEHVERLEARVATLEDQLGEAPE